jgi:hypothetical protein
VQQGLFIALGYQQKFSWKDVAASAVAAGFASSAKGLSTLASAVKAGEVTADVSVNFLKVSSAVLQVASVASQQLIENGKITSWTSLASSAVNGYYQSDFTSAQQTVNAANSGQAVAASALDNAKSLLTLEHSIEYVTPWVQLAETYVRNDGKLTPTDWANAAGSTLAAAVSNNLGSQSDSFGARLENAALRLSANALVAGALSRFDKSAAESYIYNSIGQEAGQFIGQSAVEGIQSLHLLPTDEQVFASVFKKRSPGTVYDPASANQTDQNGNPLAGVAPGSPAGADDHRSLSEDTNKRFNDLLEQYGGDASKIPASELAPFVQYLQTVRYNGEAPPILLASLDNSPLMGGLLDTMNEFKRDAAITTGYIAGLFQGAGDTVIGLGTLVKDALAADLYVQSFGYLGSKESYDKMVGLANAVAQFAAHPISTIGGQLKSTFQDINSKLETAIASDSFGDYFIYGAAVGHLAFNVISLVAGGAALIKGAASAISFFASRTAVGAAEVAAAGAEEAGAAANASSKPLWLQRIEAGNEFNAANRARYPYNEVYIDKPNGEGGYYRLDSYNPTTNEIVSRKFTQLSQITENTAESYINEAVTKYPPGATIADVPSSGSLAGSTLQGQVILEVPVQTAPIPQSILDAASKAKVIIRDVTGHRY